MEQSYQISWYAPNFINIKSLYYYKSMTISCYNLKKLIFFVIGNDSRNALSDTIPI